MALTDDYLLDHFESGSLVVGNIGKYWVKCGEDQKILVQAKSVFKIIHTLNSMAKFDLICDTKW